jgi:Spy/CpxP family protein refolding chaperone
MNKSFRWVALAGAAALAGSVAVAQAQGEGEPGRRGPGRGLGVAAMRAELGLSDDQVAQLQKLRSENRSRHIRQRAELRIARGELHDLLRADSVDESAVSAKLKQVTDLQAAATRAQVEHQLAVRRVLSPEQAAKMDSLRRERVGPRHRRRGPRPGAPAGEAPEQDE